MRRLLLPALVLGLVACSDDAGDPAPARDTATASDLAAADVPADAAAPDVTTAPDLTAAPDLAAPDNATPEDTASSCDHTGFEPAVWNGLTASGADGGFLEATALDAMSIPANRLLIEILLDERLIGAHAFFDDNYATCEVCVRIDTACTADGCDKTFLVYAGTLEIQTWEDPGGRFVGTLRDAVAREVTIAEGLPLTSTPVEDGETWCVPELSFDIGPLGEL